MAEPDDFLNSLTAGSETVKGAQEVHIIGEGGIGKTGLTKVIDGTFHITFERGGDWMGINSFKTPRGNSVTPATFDQAMMMLKKLSTKSYRDSLPFEVKTVVIDSLGYLQDLIYADIVAKNPVTNDKNAKPVKCIEDLHFYGYGAAMGYWTRFFAFVDYFIKKGINVVIISHAEKVTDVTDANQATKIWDFGLQAFGKDNVPHIIKRRADFVLHVYTTRDGVTIGKGAWAKTQADSNTSQTVVQMRKSSLRYAKTRCVNENEIDDFYYFTPHDRAEVTTELFNKIFN